MKITFEEYSSNVHRNQTEYRAGKQEKISQNAGYALDISGTVTDNIAYGVKGRTAEEVMQEAGNQDVKLLRDYMTVMSNSMSTEDFAKLQEEGYVPTDTDMDTVVTIVDKIKAEMAKAGITVEGYTDTLDADTLAAIVGSESYARAVQETFSQGNVPLTEENAVAAAAAVEKALGLQPPTQETKAYLLENQMEPTIDNVYKAEYAAVQGRAASPKYYQEDLQGYFAKAPEHVSMEEIQAQVEELFARENIPLTEENLERAGFLLERNIPLTEENISYLEEMESISFPLEQQQVWKSVVSALAEGKAPGKANLVDSTSVYEKAANLSNQVDTLLKEARTSGNVASYRQLQEVRLMMTAEANVKLAESGFFIDTSQLEELVEALKQIEVEQAQVLFGDSTNPVGDYRLYQETLTKTVEIPTMPIDLVGSLDKDIPQVTLNQVYQEGKAKQQAYAQAEEKYEQLMTAPRRDLGDRITTAFRNVDAILEEQNLPVHPDNQRAVRILGYNAMEITPENINRVKDAYRQVENVIEKITPKAVVDMIRDGVNPLETGLEELNTYLDEKTGYQEEAEKYSRYLYKLEQHGEITPEETESYIGIYRMLRQIEKSDGALVGMVVESGQTLDFANLLSAAKTRKHKGFDVTLAEDAGFLEQVKTTGTSIAEQIQTGYRTNLTDQWAANTPTTQWQEQAYQQEIWNQVQKEIGQVTDQTLQWVSDHNFSPTVDTLLAASSLLQGQGSCFQKIWDKKEKLEQLPQALENMEHWEDCLTEKDSAVASYTEYTTQLSQAAEELSFQEDNRFLDVRTMKLVHKQLSLATQAAGEEEYHIPLVMGEEVTDMRLRIRHNQGERGKLSLQMEQEGTGAITISLSLYQNKVSGYMAGEKQESLDFLEKVSQSFAQYLEDQGLEGGNIPIVQGHAKEEAAEPSQGDGETSTLYGMAKALIYACKTNRETGTMVQTGETL